MSRVQRQITHGSDFNTVYYCLLNHMLQSFLVHVLTCLYIGGHSICTGELHGGKVSYTNNDLQIRRQNTNEYLIDYIAFARWRDREMKGVMSLCTFAEISPLPCVSRPTQGVYAIFGCSAARDDFRPVILSARLPVTLRARPSSQQLLAISKPELSGDERSIDTPSLETIHTPSPITISGDAREPSFSNSSLRRSTPTVGFCHRLESAVEEIRRWNLHVSRWPPHFSRVVASPRIRRFPIEGLPPASPVTITRHVCACVVCN